MKKANLVLCCLILVFLSTGLQAKNLWAFLTYASFNSPDGPYMETYLSVDAGSVNFIKKENGKYQATVNILMTFKSGNEIKAFKKYELFSPEIADSAKTDFHFVDLQRFSLPNGTYDFEISLADKNKDVPPFPYTQTVTVDLPADKPVFSDIELVKSYTKTETPGELSKSGYDLVPYTFTFFPQNESRLVFYAELYNLEKTIGKDQKFLLSYFIESFESNLKMNSYSRVKKETAHDVNVLLSEIDISNLASGNYNLVLEARNQQNEVMAIRKIFFQRMNPLAQMSLDDIKSTEIANSFAEKITNADSLREFINSTYPIATGLEKTFIRTMLKKSDLKTRQQFFYSFWVSRDPVNPDKAWLAYKDLVKKVQVNFGTPVKKGYQTDRGRVFLEYGPPNTRSAQYSEPSNYPYEIWQYYTLNNGQRNKKFVFYSPDMVTSDFFLLHSDAIGEINNPRWKVDLRSRIYKNNDIQDTQVIKAWGDFEQDYWDLPN